MAGQEGHFDVVKFMSSTNLNDQHVNGMTHFELAFGGKLLKKRL